MLSFKLNNKDTRPITSHLQLFLVNFVDGLQKKQFINGK